MPQKEYSSSLRDGLDTVTVRSGSNLHHTVRSGSNLHHTAHFYREQLVIMFYHDYRERLDLKKM